MRHGQGQPSAHSSANQVTSITLRIKATAPELTLRGEGAVLGPGFGGQARFEPEKLLLQG
jgi:hypothetical protein